MEERTIKRENAMAAYNVASDETKKVLATLLGEDFCVAKDIKDRVKTFEDACRELGNDHPLVIQYKLYNEQMKGNFDYMEDLTSYFKLRIITAALNEGWEPQFTKDEYRWYPWYNLYTQEEIDRMDEDEKKEVGLLLWGGDASNGSLSRNGYSLCASFQRRMSCKHHFPLFGLVNYLILIKLWRI